MVRYLLVTIEYEPFAHLGRPHSISYNAVKELFGSFSNVKFAVQVDHITPSGHIDEYFFTASCLKAVEA